MKLNLNIRENKVNNMSDMELFLNRIEFDGDILYTVLRLNSNTEIILNRSRLSLWK